MRQPELCLQNPNPALIGGPAMRETKGHKKDRFQQDKIGNENINHHQQELAEYIEKIREKKRHIPEATSTFTTERENKEPSL
jgi:hypothetical protein